MKITFKLNGIETHLDVSPDRRVVDVLREDLGLTGTKESCAAGDCGACTVLVDGESKLSCLMLAAQLESREITTIEGLAQGDCLHDGSGCLCRTWSRSVWLFAFRAWHWPPWICFDATPTPPERISEMVLAGNLCRVLRVPEDCGCCSDSCEFAPGRGRYMREVFLPQTLEELWEILDKRPGAAIYAGGTDLLVKMRSGVIDPSCFVCLERIGALQGVRDLGEEVFIGPATTHSQLLDDSLIREHFQVLAKSLSFLASPPIRHMGTIGGNIVTASPAGELGLPALYVLGAEVEIGSVGGSRRLPLRSFIRGPGTVDLQNGEVLTGVWLKKAPHWNIHHYEKIGRRKAQACAIASMAAIIELSDEGRIDEARLAWGSVGPTVVTSAVAEECITGGSLCLETLRSAVRHVEEAISPIDDVRAAADFRRSVAGALLAPSRILSR